MIGMKCLCALMAIAALNAQSNACVPSTIQSAYGLTAQTAAVVSNGTCKDYFSTNGACSTPGSVINAMNTHNAWLAGKAVDAQMYGLQYINATVYFQQQNGVITQSTQPASTSNSWWSSVTSTLSGWWTTISNRATGLFKSAYAWVQGVFNNNMASIPGCLQAWGNITNGAYCLTASSNSFPYRTDISGNNGDLAWGVDQTTTGSALAKCESMIDTYCQLTFGRSILNDSQPFNTTFNWADGGISVDTCNNLRTYKKCSGQTCQPNLYDTYISIFESYFIRFVPSRDSINRLGSFLSGSAAPSTYTATAAASSGKSLRLYTIANGANIHSIGGNSGQPAQNYNVNSAARFLAILTFALFAMMI